MSNIKGDNDHENEDHDDLDDHHDFNGHYDFNDQHDFDDHEWYQGRDCNPCVSSMHGDGNSQCGHLQWPGQEAHPQVGDGDGDSDV